jgi:hypothetical protein
MAQGAILWDAMNGIRSLQDILSNDFGLDLRGWALQLATDISADGIWITGIGLNPAGDTEAWLAGIPPLATAVEGPERSALAIELLGPNPFASATAFALHLPAGGRVRAAVYSVTGVLVREILDGPVANGVRVLRWDGTTTNRLPVAAGVYVLDVTGPAGTARRKLIRVD